jgi:hypothetical protein
VSVERLRELLSYDPLTGKFKWLQYACNRAKQHEQAGYVAPSGYRVIGIDETYYMAHRLAFALMGEEMPPQVDHENGVRDDNRWVNLLPSNAADNSKNRRLHKSNRSGFPGVRFVKGRWIARVGGTKNRIEVGGLGSYEEAVAARIELEKKFGYPLRPISV